MKGFFSGVFEGILFLIALIISVSLLGLMTMIVWNAFIPNIFDLPTINFNQGVGLQVLSYLLLNREINFPTATFIEEDDTDGEV